MCHRVRPHLSLTATDKEPQMAKHLESFPSASARRYPWDQWLDGSVWQLFPGEDFTAKSSTMLGAARSHAKRLGGTLRTRSIREGDRDTIVLQFVGTSVAYREARDA